jgi:voltage-gated potassium channel Kch
MTYFVTLLGAILIFTALRDIFHELFHPSGSGSVNGAVTRFVWRVFRRLARYFPSALGLAGPVALITVITAWTILLVTGWALIYLPHLPDKFLFATELDPRAQSGFIDALYLSFVTLATLGFGDITPTSDWLRILVPLEALLGFALLTASITWVLSLYPALTRQGTLAHETRLLYEAQKETGISLGDLNESATAQTLNRLTRQLILVHSDLTQFSIVYYFHERSERTSLPANVSYLTNLAGQGDKSNSAGARLEAAMLRKALEDFAKTLAKNFLVVSLDSTEDILAAYAQNHLQESDSPGAKA